MEEASTRLSSLLSFLEEQNQDVRSSIAEIPTVSRDTLQAYSDAKAKMLSLRVELDEAQKTIRSLKETIERMKQQAAQREYEMVEERKAALLRQEQLFVKQREDNLSFIESMIKEKEQNLKVIGDLKKSMKEQDARFASDVQKLRDLHAKELKKQKEALQATEKAKRERWMQEKTKEIKEITTKGLEPELIRLVTNHKHEVEGLEQEHQKQLRRAKQDAEDQYEVKLRRTKEALMQEYDRALEGERETHSRKIRDLMDEHQNVIRAMNAKWRDTQ
eukprot:CAMPEP_0204899394 /NCGR_PEP_ID=MMETSP1397-20131031/1826_1 /ASSEMBLY_ACC=CAM_ASM_000891 /TAXON_ID=49980 /ORGANISM="Climacostomum Climacostomum virens, Strain Stock W-24" /LENGTH=274 /DNA_ID=CAMNT_0052067347 /DNA_START=113 /DNA_END=937 /DNA_ORIENTATION=+